MLVFPKTTNPAVNTPCHFMNDGIQYQTGSAGVYQQATASFMQYILILMNLCCLCNAVWYSTNKCLPMWYA